MRDNQLQETVVNPEESTLCSICYAQVPNDSLSRMSNCSHKFCKECLADYLTMLVNESKVDAESLACPECRAKIEFDLLMELLEAQIIDRYMRFMIKATADKIAKIGFVVECPNCQYAGFTDKTDLFTEIKELNCSRCCYIFCPHCQQKHNKDLTCEQYKQWKDENDLAEVRF